MKTPLTCAEKKHGNRADRKLRFLKIYKDRHGRVRYYFRRRGQSDIPLPGLPHSPEFMAAYARLTGEAVKIGAAESSPEDSVSGLIAAYYRDESFTSKAASTQGMRRRILEIFRSKAGTKPIRSMNRGHIHTFLTQLPPFERNNWIKTLRGLMKFALVSDRIAADPMIGIDYSTAEGGSIHTWTEQQIAQYRGRHANGTNARAALELLYNLAHGRADIIRLGPQHIVADPETGRPMLVFGRKKTKMEQQDRKLSIRILPELQTALDALPSGHLTFLVTRDGKPYSEKGFGIRFGDWCDQAGLPSECSSHGLRKAGLVRLAHAGATEEELRAISGHRNAGQLKPYLEQVDRMRLGRSAMDKLEAEQNRNKAVRIHEKTPSIVAAAAEQTGTKVSNRFRKTV